MEIDRKKFSEAVVEIGQMIGENVIPTGWVTTQEVADYWGITPEGARKRLQALEADGKIESRRLPNRLILWRKIGGAIQPTEIKVL